MSFYYLTHKRGSLGESCHELGKCLVISLSALLQLILQCHVVGAVKFSIADGCGVLRFQVSGDGMWWST